MPRAKFVELAGDDHMPAVGNGDAIVDEIGEFLTGVRPVETDRVLATILCTDIVRSTERALALGDRRWREVLGQYYATVAWADAQGRLTIAEPWARSSAGC